MVTYNKENIKLSPKFLKALEGWCILFLIIVCIAVGLLFGISHGIQVGSFWQGSGAFAVSSLSMAIFFRLAFFGPR